LSWLIEVKTVDMFEIYLLNLLATLGMFIALIFRAWIELKNYKMMWEKLEWRQTYQAVGRMLKAEKEMYAKTEGGVELYHLLCEMFKVSED
jgi:hypothetical protein